MFILLLRDQWNEIDEIKVAYVQQKQFTIEIDGLLKQTTSLKEQYVHLCLK